ncbi:SDR family NAD(P)-dependent oxidoreductase [Pelagibius sp.]|uniref:SDR family NAD(P)-dependent oxidoreductase n=1 Tax=Pelagibius sp. TaxID=1931238 RepID=UPI002630DC68|nr:SDR family NAD(P)-dependent oxidoreductase [Pelagibius sp.]
MLDSAGRVIMVSGASRGIGRAIAERLLDKGYALSLGARTPEALRKDLGGTAPERLLCCRYVAEDRATHERWLAETLERFGRVDGLVNNAGGTIDFTIEEGEEEDLDHLWAVNVKGPLFMTRLCLPHLKAAGNGRIVNVSSLSGKRVRNENVAYNMSKYALMALTHGSRRLGWEDGVRVTALCPSFVRTDLTAGTNKISPEEMIDPGDLAELAATVIALPNTAAVAELLVNCRLEDTL